MRWIVLFGLLVGLMAETISPKYMVAKNCAGCHKWVVDGWKTSWHSRSHYSKDPLYKASLEYMAKRLHKPLESIEVKCAQCHNPRIEKKSMSDEEIYEAGFGYKSKRLQKAISEPYVKDGINCIICHNIDRIKESPNPEDRGYRSIIWGPNDTMVGPFADARSPYHKTKQGEHFLHPNKICFICHYNRKNRYGRKIYTTGEEYEKSGSDRSCVDCHMSQKREGRIANIVFDGYVPKIREIRSHLFMGARNGDILQKALDIDVAPKGKRLYVELINKTPHNVPTGYGSRVVVVEVEFDNKVVSKKELKAVFKDKKGRITIPHLGVKKVFDNRLEPNGKRSFEFSIPNGAKEAKIHIYYRLIDEELAKKLLIHDKVFLRT